MIKKIIGIIVLLLVYSNVGVFAKENSNMITNNINDYINFCSRESSFVWNDFSDEYMKQIANSMMVNDPSLDLYNVVLDELKNCKISKNLHSVVYLALLEYGNADFEEKQRLLKYISAHRILIPSNKDAKSASEILKKRLLWIESLKSGEDSIEMSKEVCDTFFTNKDRGSYIVSNPDVKALFVRGLELYKDSPTRFSRFCHLFSVEELNCIIDYVVSNPDTKEVLDYVVEENICPIVTLSVIGSDLDNVKKKELLAYLDKYCFSNNKTIKVSFQENLVKKSISEIMFMMENDLPLYFLDQEELQKEIAFYNISSALYTKLYTNYNNPKISLEAFKILANDADAKALFDIAIETKADTELLNAILVNEDMNFAKKKFVLCFLTGHQKHLERRDSAFQWAGFMAGTIVVPVAIFAGVVVTEIIYLPKTLLAVHYYKKLGIM